MLAGLLNRKITIEIGVDSSTSVISPKLNYSEYMVTCAGVYIRSGVTQFNESEQLIFTTEFTIRYNNKSKVINNKYRIKYNNQYYRIIEVIETEVRQTIKIIGEHWYGD